MCAVYVFLKIKIICSGKFVLPIQLYCSYPRLLSIISDINLLDESALFCTVYEASKGYCIYKRGAVNLRLGNGGDGIMRPRPLTSTLELIDLPSTSVSRPTSISTCRGSYRGASPYNSNTISTVNFGYFCTSSLFAGFISWEI